MKFLTLLLLCCVAKDISGATITLDKYLTKTQIQMNEAVKAAQAKATAAGGTAKVPTAPKVPNAPNPDIVLVDPPKVPLPNPTCDLKGLMALLKAIFGRIKGSCGKVKGSNGPIPTQLEATKKNITIEIIATVTVTEQISYEFDDCSEVVDPTIKEFSSSAGKVIDSLSAASNGTASATSVDIAVKYFAISIQALFASVNSVTGSKKPPAGSNADNAVKASDNLLSTILLIIKALLEMLSSVATESSVSIGEITSTLSTAVEDLSSKVEGGSVKILGSLCIEFTASLQIIIDSVSSVDLDALTEECGTIESEIGDLTDSVAECEAGDSEETSETPAEEAPSEATPSETPSETATEAPTSPSLLEILLSISIKIKASFETMTKACAPLKVDVPAMGGKVDGSLKAASASLCSLLSIVQSSDTATVLQLSAQIDAAIAVFLKALSDLLTQVASLKESLAENTSVAATTAISAIETVTKTTLSISFKVLIAISVSFEKLDLFSTVTLEAAVAAISEIDVESADFATTATELTAITSPTELNADSCTKVVEGLGTSATEAVGEIKTDDKGKFELRISFIFNALGYTLQKLKAPKVVAGITKMQTSFSVLIKQIMEALSCAEASKAVTEGTPAAEGSGSTEGTGTKCNCKPLTPDNFKLVFAALLTITDASKTITANPSLDPQVIEMFNLILKTLFTIVSDVFTALSTKLTEQTIEVSILLSLGTKTLTTAVGGAEIDFEALSTTIDGVLCYGNVVDSSATALNSVKNIETKINEAEPTEAGALLTDLSTSTSASLTIFSTNVSTFKKYFTKTVDPVGKAVTNISSIITKCIKSVAKASGDSAQISLALNDFLLQISLSLQVTISLYSECAANTELDPEGDNALSGLKYIIKSTVSIINSILISIKIVVVDIPVDVTELYTEVSDAVSADVSSPDTDPSELGGKMKGICDKHQGKKDADGSGSGSDGSGGDESGGDESGGDESGGDESGGDESGGDEE